ncbi:MAG TPA: polysaccharide biosynthesis C-terminal domain-containing protein, partial [Acetobacteraceae bacterium]|nr:polysaccharide biosynthesis C-terminal domain-containing protein [Acetobacteraceae bacterium]
ALVEPLLRLGGWMTFAGLMTQALLYADRFLIGALLTLSAVAFYATPLDLVMRMWILPVAVTQALMPALAASFATRPAEAAALLRQGVLGIVLLCLPACLLLAGAAWELLALWLGREFADGGAGVLRLLGIGIFFSCLAFAPGSLLDAIGRPDITARFMLAQAVLFLPLTAAAILWLGIEGAAMVWALRCATDAFGKAWLVARHYLPAVEGLRAATPPLLVASAGLLAMALPLSRPALAALAVLTVAVTTAWTWRALTDEERRGLLGRLRRARVAGGA